MSFISEHSQAIREDFATGEYSKAELARIYNTSPRTIGRILNGHNTPVQKKKVEAKIEPVKDVAVYGYVATDHLIVVTRAIGSKSEANTILRSDSRYDMINDIIEEVKANGDMSLLSVAFEESSVAEKLKAKSFGNVTVNPEVGVVQYRYSGSGEVVNLPDRLTARLLSIFENDNVESAEFKGLLKFVNNLVFVRNESIVDQLYNFLEAKNIAITPDGMVRCYKKVRSDFKDIYTGTIDNTPGETPQVRFDYVDSNPNVTCSQGLHVCSWSYLDNYGSQGCNSSSDVIVEVEVNPADFVAVPKDYNDAKARVCKYKVIKVCASETPWEIPYNQRFNA